jgi:23S rRNA pseudouridine1911/1915/1917 synthase
MSWKPVPAATIGAVVTGRLLPPYAPRVLFEDDDLLVVDKPPFLEAHPSKPGSRTTLWDELRGLLAYEIANGGQVGIINRLDRETSGLTLVAKHREAARRYSLLMQGRAIEKEYLALAHGHPAEDEWRVDGPLLREGSVRDARVWVKQCVDAGGVPAMTDFHVERRFERDGAPFGLVRAFPVTGRMHQIRVHLAHSGHGIVGDKIYGPAGEECYLEFIETGWTPALAARLLLPRQALHSAVLRVEDREWRSEWPEDLANFLPA